MYLSTGNYLDKLKLVKVILTHISGLISLLSVFDKIIEKIIHSKLQFFRNTIPFMKINLVLERITIPFML